MPKKFFRLGGGKNGVIRLSPSPPPQSNQNMGNQNNGTGPGSQVNYHSNVTAGGDG